jgi:hypothetical protein
MAHAASNGRLASQRFPPLARPMPAPDRPRIHEHTFRPPVRHRRGAGPPVCPGPGGTRPGGPGSGRPGSGRPGSGPPPSPRGPGPAGLGDTGDRGHQQGPPAGQSGQLRGRPGDHAQRQDAVRRQRPPTTRSSRPASACRRTASWPRRTGRPSTSATSSPARPHPARRDRTPTGTGRNRQQGVTGAGWPGVFIAGRIWPGWGFRGGMSGMSPH